MSIFRSPSEKSFDRIFMDVRGSLEKSLIAHFGKPSSDYFASVTRDEILEADGIGLSGLATVVARLKTIGVKLWLDGSVDKATRQVTLHPGGPAHMPAHYYRDYLMADPVLDDTIVALGELYGELSVKDLLDYLDDSEGFMADAVMANDQFGNGEWTHEQVFGAYQSFNDQFDASLHRWSNMAHAGREMA
jgi:hypothetical protein